MEKVLYSDTAASPASAQAPSYVDLAMASKLQNEMNWSTDATLSAPASPPSVATFLQSSLTPRRSLARAFLLAHLVPILCLSIIVLLGLHPKTRELPPPWSDTVAFIVLRTVSVIGIPLMLCLPYFHSSPCITVEDLAAVTNAQFPTFQGPFRRLHLILRGVAWCVEAVWTAFALRVYIIAVFPPRSAVDTEDRKEGTFLGHVFLDSSFGWPVWACVGLYFVAVVVCDVRWWWALHRIGSQRHAEQEGGCACIEIEKAVPV